MKEKRKKYESKEVVIIMDDWVENWCEEENDSFFKKFVNSVFNIYKWGDLY